MSRCPNCGEPLPSRVLESVARQSHDAAYHATRGNREACIRDLKAALKQAEAFHAKCEGLSEPEAVSP
jgi:hypothetical protein